jgi:predicted nucleotidyltransferase
MNAQTEIVAWLQQRNQSQARLRSQLETMLRQDSRLSAAWWFGSYARGTSDALSDLDIWLVVDDRHLAQLVDQRYRCVEQLGPPLMLLEVWGNAPHPGAYLMANYLQPGGLVQVDWYWQGAAEALLPRDGRVIFDRIGLASAPDLVTVDFARASRGIEQAHTEQDDRARLSFGITFFWSMVPIVAKKIARGEFDAAQSMLDRLPSRVNTITSLLGVSAYQPQPASDGESVTAHALSQLSALRRIAAAMQALEPACVAAGADLPSEIHAPIYAQMDRVEQTIRLGVSLQEVTHDVR